MKKVLEKGYTITVVSWENDGDNYKTKSKTVKTIEEARVIHKICKELFMLNDVGNSMDNEAKSLIKEYLQDNHEMKMSYDNVKKLAWELMGSSEYYDFRVCESVQVVYSPEDIYLEEVNF
jgi:hypothetical protein